MSSIKIMVEVYIRKDNTTLSNKWSSEPNVIRLYELYEQYFIGNKNIKNVEEDIIPAVYFTRLGLEMGIEE